MQGPTLTEQVLDRVGKGISMANWAKRLSVFIAVALMAYLPTTQQASAISAELAKKCRALAVKAHPTSRPGSKATGAGKAERDYFQACLAKSGKMEN